MNRHTLLILAVVAFSGSELQAAEHRAVMPEQHRSLFQKYCYDCHDSDSMEGNINLKKISFHISQDIPTADRWSKVLNAINSGEMPPKDATQISDADKSAFLEELSNQMVIARKVLSDTGGRITLRRLNRREYANTIGALLGVRPDVSNLPDDQAVSGFDTQGASLFFSSDQLEQYLATAKSTLKLALQSKTNVASKTRRIEPEEEYNPYYAEAAAAMKDRSARAQAFLAQNEKPASAFGLLDEYQAKKQKVAEWLPQYEQYFARPETKTGVTLIVTIKQGGPTKIKLPTLHENGGGKYLVRVRAAAYPDAAERFSYLEFTTGDGTGHSLLGWRKVTASMDHPQTIEFPVEHRPGEKMQIWIHQRTHQDRGDKNLATIDMRANGIGTPPGLWVDWAELEGPLPDNGRPDRAAKVLPAQPADYSDLRYATSVLERFALAAFRGDSPAPEFLNRLVQRYDSNRAKGMKQTDALIDPLAIILASPRFVYMMESQDQPRLSDRELAIRLSYFLWSSPPDEELLSLAGSGRLSDPAVLKQQTSRLLADSQADEFVEGFVHQWLQMERLDMFQFDGVQFPTFDNAVRENARLEIYETIRLMLNEGLPLRTLLRSDFVVVNDLMAGYYGIEGVEGHEFRSVHVPENSLRGGLLGTAAVLAMGSDGQRSSPVERGAWVLRHLLNNPPPPAPPNVPQLSRLAGQVLSARELGVAHQEQPQCANCHQKIDPIGFGLENFDAAGLWRDVETIVIGKRKASRTKTFPIDPSGQLPNGQTFKNYFGLRDAVSEHTDDFARSLAESLISYGLGRPYGFTDQELADDILQQASHNEYELNGFIHALVQSAAFQKK